MANNKIAASKCYRPDPDLVQYISDELRMKEIRQSRENAGEDLSTEEKRFERNLDKRKSTWMDKIFQKTADLTFFLECIAAKSELGEEFKDEYDDLFGFVGILEYVYHTTALYENNLYRLISSILQIDNKKTRDSTMTATYISQSAVYEKMLKFVEADSLTYTDPEIAQKVIEDFSYCMAWIKFLSLPIKSKGYSRREIDPHNPVLQDAEST